MDILFLLVASVVFGSLFLFFAYLLHQDFQTLKENGILVCSVTMPRYLKWMVVSFVSAFSSVFLLAALSKVVA